MGTWEEGPEGRLRDVKLGLGGNCGAAAYEEAVERITNHIQQHMQGGIVLARAIREEKEPSIERPEPPAQEEEESDLCFKARSYSWE